MLDGWRKVADRPLRILNWIPYVITVGITLFLILFRENIPEKVPMHWNAAGEIDRYSDPLGYIVLLIFMYFILAFHALMMCMIPVFSGNGNFFKKEYAVHATEEDRMKGARATLYMLMWTDILMELIFVYIIVCGVFVRTIGAWFVPAVFIGLGGILVWFFWRIQRIQKEIL